MAGCQWPVYRRVCGLPAQLPVGIEGGRPRVRHRASGSSAQPAPDVGEGRVSDVKIDHGPLADARVREAVGVEMGHLRDAFAVAVFDPEPPVPLAGAAAQHKVELASGAGGGYGDRIPVGLPAEGDPVAAGGLVFDPHRAPHLCAVGVGVAAHDRRAVVELVGCSQVLDLDTVERCNSGERFAGFDDVDVGDRWRLQGGCTRRLRQQSEEQREHEHQDQEQHRRCFRLRAPVSTGKRSFESHRLPPF